MEIAICANCGAVLKQKGRGCAACGAAQSRFASTTMTTLASTAAPLVVSVAPDRLILERIVSSRQVATLVPSADSYLASEQSDYFDPSGLEATFQSLAETPFLTTTALNQSPSTGNGSYEAEGNGSNGHGNGNGNGNGNGHSSDEFPFEPTSSTAAAAPPKDFFATNSQFTPSQSPGLAPWERDDAAANSDNSAHAEAGVELDSSAGHAAVGETGDGQILERSAIHQSAELAVRGPTDENGAANGSESNQATNGAIGDFAFNKAAEVQESSTPFSSPAEDGSHTVVSKTQPPPDEGGKSDFFDAAPTVVAAAAGAAAGAVAGAVASAAMSAMEPSAPTRPHVAGPDFFGGDKQKDRDRKTSDEDRPKSQSKQPSTSTAAAFDFFAASSAEPKPSSRSEEKSERSERSERSEKSEKSERSERSESRNESRGDKSTAHDTFEQLLKQKSTGNNKDKRADNDDDDEDEDERPKKKAQSKDVDKSKPKRAPVIAEDDDDDFDDDEDSPRSRRGSDAKTKKAQTKKRQAEDDDDDDDDDRAHIDDEDVPQRRSFSGSPSSLKRSGRAAIGASRRGNDDDDDDDSRSKLRDKFSSGGLFSVAGFPVGFKLIAVTLGIMGMLFFAVFHAIGNIMGPAPAANQAQTAPGLPGCQSGGITNLGGLMPDTPRIAGIWRIAALLNGQVCAGQLELHQSGTTLMGKGADASGTFNIQGQIKVPTTVYFKKQYVDPNGRIASAPIFYVGEIALETLPLRMSGVWEFTKKSGSAFGYLNKERKTQVKGTWQAQLDHVMKVEEGGASAIQNLLPNDGGPGAKPAKAFNIIDFMTGNGIFVFVGVGTALVMGSFQLFGPSGLINVWNKQQYIPSQVKAQHCKIRAQLAKPAKKGSLPLGQRREWKWWFPMPWVIKDLALPPEMRKINPHVLVLGQGGKGKTRLVAGMASHDILSDDRAVVVIDSDGTLVELLTRWISAHPKGKELTRRVILIDATYKGNHSAYNPLELEELSDMQTAAASIVYGFKAIYTEPPGSQSQWNAQTADILRNAVLLLMANGKTLTDLPNLLNDNDFRDVLLEAVERRKDERIEFATLLDQWGRYKKLARTDQWITWVEPILNRVNPMLSNPRIRSILTKPVGDLSLVDVINSKKILLVKIPQGEFGQDANLLGSLIVSGVKQAALTLSSKSMFKQNPVALYLDNFDNFIEKETVENITSETKKFKIGFIGVTKSLQHLPEDFRNELIINIGTLCTFALSKKDGDLLGPQMFPIDGRKVKHQTMANIFNRVNATPQFELVSDEEKLNIDKVVRQEEKTFFCYKMGAEAGLFNLISHPFEDIPDNKVKEKLIERMHLSSSKKAQSSDS